jgi:3,4-dihydroxy 2-butanone 4-phosphate synthase/GTP cyclohydrolase II
MSHIDETQISTEFPLASIEEALDDLRAGKMIVVLDDEDRENEGDIVCAAETITPSQVNFIIQEARGLLCVPMAQDRLARLGLDLMVQDNTAPLGTGFTVSVDAVRGTTTGISAPDRAATVRALASVHTRPEDLARPGHVFPLRAVSGGVLRRTGHTEAVVDLMNLAGMQPVGVLCEILDADGTMGRPPYLHRFARRHNLKVINIASLIEHRFRKERLVRRITSTELPTRHGTFELHLYKNTVDGAEHLLLALGDLQGEEPPLTRMHSSCVTGDLLGSLRCDCGNQMDEALARIGKEGRGVFLYLFQEGRGIGLGNKIRTYALQDQGLDTVEANLRLGFQADQRDYGVGAQMLADLGVRRIRLLTNNPAKRSGLERYGINVTERVPIVVGENPKNERYLATKQKKLGHVFESGESAVRHD